MVPERDQGRAAAEDYGIKFSIDDANLDLQKSLAAVDDNLSKGTNVLVFTPANEKASGPTITKAVKTMPVVCEGSPTDGCLSLVSIDDFKAGELVVLLGPATMLRRTSVARPWCSMWACLRFPPR